MTANPHLQPLSIAGRSFQSRLFVGTGKYKTYDLMKAALAASECEVVTVAVRRERLYNEQGKSLLEFLDLKRYTVLPNTAGCFSSEDAVRVAMLGRDLLQQLGNPGASWVKLEVLGDRKTLLPDPVGTIEATRTLVKEGFQVLAYSSDDPITAMRIKEAGASSVMPAGSPIGSGQGVLNRCNILLCLELLKQGDAAYPVIVDAGVGSASDVAIAMELGADGVLLNTAIAHAADPVLMAHAMRHACIAGHQSARAGRIPRRLYASASSPWDGTIASQHSSQILSHIPGE
jgi:thiazole synthase